MSSRFRTELTIVPTARITVARQGLATTIDWNAKGTDRRSFSPASTLRTLGDPRLSGPLPTDRYLIPGTRKEFGGGDVARMTSPGLSEFKALLVATRDREREIRTDMSKAKRQLVFAWATRALAWTTLIPVVSKTVRKKAGTALASRRSDVQTLKGNLTASRVSVSFDMETAVAGPHQRMLEAFENMATSERSWVLETTQQIDRVKARSFADTVVSRAAANLGRRTDQLVDTNDLPPAILIQNCKATAYFYPGFVLVVSKAQSDFAIIDLKELSVSYTPSNFTETEFVPRDAAMTHKVWAKSNKNGTRDKRFRDNRELPVLLYGKLSIGGPGGLDEAFMFSRNEACYEFSSAVNDLKRILMSTEAVPRSSVPSRLPSKRH